MSYTGKCGTYSSLFPLSFLPQVTPFCTYLSGKKCEVSLIPVMFITFTQGPSNLSALF